VGDLADEVERARTPRTPLRALTGVWLTVAVTVALMLTLVAVTLYFSSAGRNSVGGAFAPPVTAS
jgi:hypothetical protein